MSLPQLTTPYDDRLDHNPVASQAEPRSFALAWVVMNPTLGTVAADAP